jgi:hypothetical protein
VRRRGKKFSIWAEFVCVGQHCDSFDKLWTVHLGESFNVNCGVENVNIEYTVRERS